MNSNWGRILSKNKKVFIIGLDGGTWKVFEPLFEEGRMECFRRLVTQGASGILKSAIPPISEVSWSSFLTGANPGKHGVIGSGSLDEHFVSRGIVDSTSISMTTIWEYLSQLGKRVISLNVPMTCPARAANGIIIGDTFTRNMHSNFTFPKELKGELLEKIRNFEILHNQAHDKYFPHKIFKSFTDKLTDMLQARLKAASYLMMNVPWDVFMVHIQSSDLLQHPMWCFLDAKHSLFDKEKRDYVVATFYESLDKGIGKLTSQVMDIYPNDDVLTILLSDHGFQSHLRSVNLQNWLHQNGWLRIQKSDAQARISNKFLLLIRKVDIFELRKKILPQAQRHNLARFLVIPYDLEKSRAISLGNNSWAFIALLDKSEAFRKRLASELLSLRDKYTGNKIVRQVLRKESVYSGSKLSEIPDLIVVPCDGYTFSRGHPYEPFLRNVEPGRDYHIGTHHRDGIIVMNGPGIIQKKDVEASIIDVAPTILCYLGVPIPNDEMDGKILEDLFSSRIIEETAPAHCDSDVTVKQRD